MENIITKVDGKTLTITVDLSARGKTSSTGKTTLIATTGGAQPVDCDGRQGVKVAINVMVPLNSTYKTNVTARVKRVKKPAASIEDVPKQPASDEDSGGSAI